MRMIPVCSRRILAILEALPRKYCIGQLREGFPVPRDNFLFCVCMRLISFYMCPEMTVEANPGTKVTTTCRVQSVAVVEELADVALQSSRFLMDDSVCKTSAGLAPLRVRLRHMLLFCERCSQDSMPMPRIFKDTFRLSLYRFFWPPTFLFPLISSP